MYDTVLQDQILWNLRVEDNTETDIFFNELLKNEEDDIKNYYVDANHFSSFLHATSKALGISNMYNFYLLNPSKSVSSNDTYGYRSGYSQAEIEELETRWKHQFSSLSELYEILDIPLVPCDEDPNPPKIPSLLQPSLNRTKIEVVDYYEASNKFAKWFLNSTEKGSAPAKADTDPDDPSTLFSFARGEDKSIFILANRVFPFLSFHSLYSQPLFPPTVKNATFPLQSFHPFPFYIDSLLTLFPSLSRFSPLFVF